MTTTDQPIVNTQQLIKFGRENLPNIEDKVERKARKKEIDKLAKERKAFSRAERKRYRRITKHVWSAKKVKHLVTA